MTVATQDTWITEFAGLVYAQQKDNFVRDFARFIEQRIASWKAELWEGQSMTLAESKHQLHQEFFNQ